MPTLCRALCKVLPDAISSGSVSCSVMFDSVTSQAVAHQAPLSMEFSRQEHWSGLPFPSPEDLPYPGIELRSLELQADSLLSELQGRSSITEVSEKLNRKAG